GEKHGRTLRRFIYDELEDEIEYAGKACLVENAHAAEASADHREKSFDRSPAAYNHGIGTVALNQDSARRLLAPSHALKIAPGAADSRCRRGNGLARAFLHGLHLETTFVDSQRERRYLLAVDVRLQLKPAFEQRSKHRSLNRCSVRRTFRNSLDRISLVAHPIRTASYLKAILCPESVHAIEIQCHTATAELLHEFGAGRFIAIRSANERGQCHAKRVQSSRRHLETVGTAAARAFGCSRKIV